MSGANELKEKILAEASSQAENVLEEARRKAAAITAKGEEKAASRKAEVLEQARLQAEERRRRAKTIAALEARKEILAAKEELIEETFKQAITRLCGLDQQEYEKLLFPMLIAAVQTGTEEIIFAPADRDRFSEFIARVNTALAGQGKSGQLTLAADSREMRGGFVLRSGDIEINSSFDSILRMLRDQLEPEVAAILFS